MSETPRKKSAAVAGTPPVAPSSTSGVSLHVLSKDSVVSRLKKRSPASFLIWVEAVAAAECPEDAAAPAVVTRVTTVSVKLQSAIWHEPLNLPIKIRCQKGKAQVCKADQKGERETSALPRNSRSFTQVGKSDFPSLLAGQEAPGRVHATAPVAGH